MSELIARARRHGTTVDLDLWKQLQQLSVDGGTLVQVVAQILDQRAQLQEALSAGLMISDEGIRKAIGMQGQISGIDIVLGVIDALMQPPPEETENVQTP